MRKLLPSILTILLLVSVCSFLNAAETETQQKTLSIKWQKYLAASDSSCCRFTNTEKELEKAVSTLEKTLAPLGISVELEADEINKEDFLKDPTQANVIWLADKRIEDWLSADIGKAKCDKLSTELGKDIECRTIMLDGKTYDSIPSELIVKAALLASSEMLTASPIEHDCVNKECPHKKAAVCPKTGKPCKHHSGELNRITE
ncbi:DUF2703 domain-containing protein [bacterium]|nr:DUF2703 domain-containing protein [bacterium]